MSDRTRPGPSTARTVLEIVGGSGRRRPDRVVTEEPLELRLGWPGQRPTRLVVTMRTPGADFDLAAGFLLAEGLIAFQETPRTVTYCLDATLTTEQRYNVVTVELAKPPLRPPPARFGAISSACGVCGAQSLDDVYDPRTAPVSVDRTVAAGLLPALPEALREAQQLFARTGAAHAAGVYSFEGDVVVVREDVGRHNAVDKVLGARVLGAVAYDADSVLCVSGRIGFDIVAKAAAGRIAVVAGVGGPSSLAVRLAERAGVTVCGFARDDRVVVYTHPGRVALAD